jgi:hypothetical protein
VAFQRRPHDHPGDEAAEQNVEAELAGEQDEAEDEDDGDPHRQLAARLEGPLQRRPAAPGVAHRAEREDQGEGDEAEQDHRLVQRVGGREDQRHQQDRAELTGRACGQEVGAEAGLQLAAVAQDRDQRADRGRRHRRAGVEEGEHDPGRGERPADPIGERDREQPAKRPELHRQALDPVEVDLVAGEEEEHPEPEVGEEFDEVIGLREAEQFWADHDPQQQLEHDDGWGEALRHRGHGHRCDCSDDDDCEERPAVDLDRGCRQGEHGRPILGRRAAGGGPTTLRALAPCALLVG